MKQRMILLPLCLLGMLSLFCTKKAMLSKYYLIERPFLLTDADSTQSAQLPFNVGVHDFQISKAFDQTRIALRTKSHELNYYHYHHWAVSPATSVADLLCVYFQKNHFFRQCNRGFRSHQDFYITGNILALERMEQGKDEYAHLAGWMRIVSSKTDDPVLTHSFDRKVNLDKERSMNDFASVISGILMKETDVFMQQMLSHFQN